MLKTLKKYTKKIDLFSAKFEFKISENLDSRASLLGGILSFLIYFLSLIYLFYLLILYFDN
jgi:hypothetical protein